MHNTNRRKTELPENSILGKALLAALACVLLFVLLGWWCVPAAVLLGLCWTLAELYRRTERLEQRVRLLERCMAQPGGQVQAAAACTVRQQPSQGSERVENQQENEE